MIIMILADDEVRGPVVGPVAVDVMNLMGRLHCDPGVFLDHDEVLHHISIGLYSGMTRLVTKNIAVGPDRTATLPVRMAPPQPFTQTHIVSA